MATLELAANKGLGNVSMNMIADKVGIKKPSLYNHFSSKEELVEEMYQFLREEAKKKANVGGIDYTTIFADKSALEILRMMVGGYFHMNQQEHMLNFYKVIYSERTIQPQAIGSRYKVRHRAEYGISIAKEYWGLGIGQALTFACIECAKSAGYM